MFRRLSFRRKLFLYFSITFGVFTILVLAFQFERERNFSKSNFEVTLDNITRLSYSYFRNQESYLEKDYWLMDSLTTLTVDHDIRVSIIALDGTVVFDSDVEDVSGMKNHLDRPELQEAMEEGRGSNIRDSETTGNSYYYYARTYPDYFVRAAAIYDVDVRDSMHVEHLFIVYLVLLFVLFAIALAIITRRISETITKLKDFIIRLTSGEKPPSDLKFPEDDLGAIGSEITSIYHELTRAQQEIRDEQEKLFAHLDSLDEGIAFFTPDRKNLLANKNFIQNLNLVSGQSAIKPEELFSLPAMDQVVKFIDRTLASPENINPDALPNMVEVMERSSRFFNIRCMFFADSSFEIAITNTTRLEKRKRISQEMTSNISHELKTPITSILGYLETLQEDDVPPKIRKQFLKRALRQTERLTDLIDDISSLNKIQEAAESYPMEEVNIRKIIDEVHQHLKMKLDAQNIRVNIDVSKRMEINGNVSLLFSIFYNLFDNVIKYGGEGLRIKLDNYLEDRKYYYFSFSNSGNSVEEVHLTRIFERFYRIDTGRSREQGGTGLGLSIVKNAIELHGGTITAKSRPGGGLIFLFSLSK